MPDSQIKTHPENQSSLLTSKYKLLLILSVLLLIVTPVVSFGQNSANLKASLSGMVNDTEGQPLKYATVVVSGGKSISTDKLGRFLIQNLSAGTHRSVSAWSAIRLRLKR